MNLEFSRQILEKYSYIKFHKYASSGGRVVPYGRKEGRTNRQTNMTKLVAVIRNLGTRLKTYAVLECRNVCYLVNVASFV
jgi:hypothetical protein